MTPLQTQSHALRPGWSQLPCDAPICPHPPTHPLNKMQPQKRPPTTKSAETAVLLNEEAAAARRCQHMYGPRTYKQGTHHPFEKRNHTHSPPFIPSTQPVYARARTTLSERRLVPGAACSSPSWRSAATWPSPSLRPAAISAPLKLWEQ